MSESTSLPLPLAELPESLHRFADPKAPGPARLMAAKGLVPIKGGDLVTLMVQLAADPDAGIASAADATLTGLPENVLRAAAEAAIPGAILEALARKFIDREPLLEALVMNHNTPDAAIIVVARSASDHLCEVIATNQQRLLNQPVIVEALYKNRNMRMSTADRLVELCARNGVELTGIPSFAEHVAAITGQLIPEPTDEPLPGDLIFQEALAADADDPDAIVREVNPLLDEQEEKVADKFKPLSFQIKAMTKSEKLRLAVIGDAAARALLVRDTNKGIAMAAMSSPKMTEKEATNIACSREVGADVLRYIGTRRKWLQSYELKMALIFNPKTPVGISMAFIAHLRLNDLRTLAKSRSVAQPLKTLARQRVEMLEKAGRG
ncbi:MAG: hypothetical protein IPL19_11855 [Sandaracinaceae bacterium]|jgi:hypothetical protein|nr:hypothetical protein [Sandaracinaceae bacterium]MBK8408665.1 hypothetical protein [Sandaracinaceae bacterium]MBK8592056.1 hypothetical protein [Sandaracinaceae bacterium]